MVTSRQIIAEATRRYRAGTIGDDDFLRVVDPVTVNNGAAFLLRTLKRERRPAGDPDVIEADYRVIEPDMLDESET